MNKLHSRFFVLIRESFPYLQVLVYLRVPCGDSSGFYLKEIEKHVMEELIFVSLLL